MSALTKLLSTAETADLLGVNKNTILLYARTGKIPASFLARKWRFLDKDVLDFIDSQRRKR